MGYWFWYFLFAANPSFLLLGMVGVFGDEAKKVADELAEILAILLVAFATIAALFGLAYLVLRAIGIVP